jgi:SAM-dependent methyltransferase
MLRGIDNVGLGVRDLDQTLRFYEMLGWELLERSKRGATLGAQGAKLVEGDATAIPFADERFAAVVCFTMLHHVPSPEKQDQLLREITRVLRPGGVFAGSDSIGTGIFFRLLHVGDTLVPVPVETLSARLSSAGLHERSVSIGGNSFRFRAIKPLAA